MFERYTERARRAIFFARYEASAFGSEWIETHHLLLGVLQDHDLARLFLKSEDAPEKIRKDLETRFPPVTMTPVSRDLPLSKHSKRVLAYAAEEAERLESKSIGSGHLLLGLLREDGGEAAKVLGEQGLRLAEARQILATIPASEPGVSREALHRLIDELPEERLDSAGRSLQALAEEIHFAPTSGIGYLGPPATAARYSEKLRRALFFARYEASQLGSPTIESEHLLLGLLREDKMLAVRFLMTHGVIEEIRKEVAQLATAGQKGSSILDLPLGPEGRRVMESSAKESERLKHQQIGTEELLLGLLLEENGLAAKILNGHGVTLAKAQQEIRPQA